MYCTTCGKEVLDEAVICPGCGCILKKEDKKKEVTSSENNKKEKTAIILGILGIVFAWLFALVGHILSIIGIVFGIKGYKETGKMTGLVLSIIGEVCAIFSSIIGAVIGSAMF